MNNSKTIREQLLKKVPNLTETEIKEIMVLYYDKSAKIKEIQEKYNIKGVKLSELRYLFPTEEVDIYCKYCNLKLVKNKPQREKYIYSKEDEYCIFCGHENSISCRCDNCEKERLIMHERELKFKREFLQKWINLENYKPIDYSNLLIKDKLYLGTLLRACINETFEVLNPISEYSGKLVPASIDLESIIEYLHNKEIIKIHPSSNLKYFLIDYKTNSFTYDWKNIKYFVNINSKEGKEKKISELLNPGYWDELNSDEFLNIWKEILYWECIELFDFRMSVYNFNYNIGKETKALFEDLITKLSISQIYSIIWNGVKNAAAYSQEKNVLKKQAANSVVLRMRTAADKILSGQWQGFLYVRPKECEQSLLSEYFFNSILKICDKGWTTIPFKIENIFEE